METSDQVERATGVYAIAARATFGLTVLGGAGLLALAVWPGLLEDVLFSFLLICFTVPLIGAWSALTFGLALSDFATWFRGAERRGWWGLASAAVVCATAALLSLHAPQKVVFAFCDSEFRSMAEDAPAGEFRGVELNRRVGPYEVDRYGADGLGGVFFRTATGPDGIGPDQMSYGFAFRPHPEGCPFGKSRYSQHHLFGDWYGFAVSDD